MEALFQTAGRICAKDLLQVIMLTEIVWYVMIYVIFWNSDLNTLHINSCITWTCMSFMMCWFFWWHTNLYLWIRNMMIAHHWHFVWSTNITTPHPRTHARLPRQVPYASRHVRLWKKVWIKRRASQVNWPRLEAWDLELLLSQLKGNHHMLKRNTYRYIVDTWIVWKTTG